MIGERRGTGGWDSVLGTEAHLVAPGGEWRSELYGIAVEQFTAAADVLGLDPELRARLKEPRRSLVVNRELAGRAGDTGLLAEALGLWAASRQLPALGVDVEVLEQALALEDHDRDVAFQKRPSMNVAQVFEFTGETARALLLGLRRRDRHAGRGERPRVRPRAPRVHLDPGGRLRHGGGRAQGRPAHSGPHRPGGLLDLRARDAGADDRHARRRPGAP